MRQRAEQSRAYRQRMYQPQQSSSGGYRTQNMQGSGSGSDVDPRVDSSGRGGISRQPSHRDYY